MISMKISAVVPVYNSEKFIADCLNSLLNQKMKFDEIIVVDDASTDKTVQVAKQFPVKVIELKENRGRSCARNVGLSKIKSNFVLFAEADAIYSKNFLQLCLKHFNDPKIGGVIGKQEVWNKNDSIWTKCKAAERESNFINYKPFSAWVYRTKLVKKVNGFDETLDFGEDVDLAKRIQALGYSLKYEPAAIWKHFEPTNFLRTLKRQWVFGLGVVPFYRKNDFPFRNILLDSLFFLTILAGLLFNYFLILSFLYIAAKLAISRKAFYFIQKKHFLHLGIFLIIPALVFKFARILRILSLR